MKIKILSLNMWHGGKLSGCFPFIEQVNADVMCLQEVVTGGSDFPDKKNLNTIKVLREMFPGYYFSKLSAEAKFVFKEGVFDLGNLVISKFPIVSEKSLFFHNGYCEKWEDGVNDSPEWPSSLQHIEIDVNGNKIDIGNVHGVWGHNGKDNERRLKMSEMIVKEFEDKERVLLAGDFNCNPDTKTIRGLEQQLNLENVFDRMLRTTFNVRQKFDGAFATAVVDMMLVSKNMKVKKRECQDIEVSDHLPLEVELEI